MHGDLVVVDDVPGEFAERVIEAFLGRPAEVFTLALSGGETARRCYERLADAGGTQIDWWQVDVYWGDERCVPLEDPDSNYRLGREALLARVGAVNANYPMRCEEGSDSYHQRIGQLGRIDLVHLGLGADGHTASLFPGSSGLVTDPGRLVALNEDPSGTNPHQRMTLTYAGIERARLAIVTVAGEDKADALARVHNGEDLPATHVKAERLIWLADPAAASQISRQGEPRG